MYAQLYSLLFGFIQTILLYWKQLSMSEKVYNSCEQAIMNPEIVTEIVIPSLYSADTTQALNSEDARIFTPLTNVSSYNSGLNLLRQSAAEVGETLYRLEQTSSDGDHEMSCETRDNSPNIAFHTEIIDVETVVGTEYSDNEDTDTESGTPFSGRNSVETTTYSRHADNTGTEDDVHCERLHSVERNTRWKRKSNAGRKAVHFEDGTINGKLVSEEELKKKRDQEAVKKCRETREKELGIVIYACSEIVNILRSIGKNETLREKTSENIVQSIWDKCYSSTGFSADVIIGALSSLKKKEDKNRLKKEKTLTKKASSEVFSRGLSRTLSRKGNVRTSRK